MEHSPRHIHNFNTLKLLVDDQAYESVPEARQGEDISETVDTSSDTAFSQAQINRMRRQRSKSRAEQSDEPQPAIVDTRSDAPLSQAQQNRMRRQRGQGGSEKPQTTLARAASVANESHVHVQQEPSSAVTPSTLTENGEKKVTPGDLAAGLARRLGGDAIATAQARQAEALVETVDVTVEGITEQISDEQKLDAAEEDAAEAEKEKWYKVTDNRKWSRVDYLGREVGPQSDMNFTAPVKWPAEAVEVSDESEPNSSGDGVDMKPLNVVEVQKSETQDKVPRVPAVQSLSEKYASHMNNDPAVEQAIIKLNSLREQAADITADRQSRLFSVAGGKREIVMAEYNQQIVKLGELIHKNALDGNVLYDSQKNVLVTKFLVEEQARLRYLTDEKIKDKKMNKLVTWMNIHGKAVAPELDNREVVKTLEAGNAEDDKFTIAHAHLESLYKKAVHTEQIEHRKHAGRAVAIGAVGLVATTLGINPSLVGDSLNSIAASRRKN